jgi:phosphatidylethanolamine/phosphatidyl-N-methylethanolamine N-methyltransferase
MREDTRLFLREALRNPRRISALAPSSPALARAMAAGLGPNSGPVVEFGPGTGRLTEAILATGLAPALLTLFELNADFVRHLRLKFPGVRVVHGPAQEAPALLGEVAVRVVSGLPLLSMPASLREAIVESAFQVLAPGGEMVQFTYGRGTPLTGGQLTRLGLVMSRGPRVWANLPPARVLRFHRA